MHKYALVVISNGGEVMTFTSEVKGHSVEDVVDEIKEAHGIDNEIVDIVLLSSKSKVEFEQLDLSGVDQGEIDDIDDLEDLEDQDDTDRAPIDDYADDTFENEDNDYECDD